VTQASSIKIVNWTSGVIRDYFFDAPSFRCSGARFTVADNILP